MAARQQKRMGRPPKPASEKLAQPVQVNLTREELRALRAVAAGEPLAAYLRRIVLRHLARRREKRE